MEKNQSSQNPKLQSLLTEEIKQETDNMREKYDAVVEDEELQKQVEDLLKEN